MTAADDFEALVRRELQHVANAAFNPSRAYVTGRMNAATDAIKTAAASWGLAEYGVTADRRAVLARKTDGATHYDIRRGLPACRPDDTRMLNPAVTSSRGHVTCASCKRTRAYQDAS